MPRVCTVCNHSDRAAIEAALVASEGSNRRIAAQFGIAETSLRRHKADHLPDTLLRARAAEETTEAINVMAELRRCAERLNLLFDACDGWLRDAEDPNRYEIGPRAEEIFVTYLESIGDRKIRKKARLSELLAKVEGSYEVAWSEAKHADPRELVLKTYDRLESQLTLIAKLIGQLDERPQFNLSLSPEWAEVRRRLVGSLADYPDARAAAAGALVELEANGYRH